MKIIKFITFILLPIFIASVLHAQIIYLDEELLEFKFEKCSDSSKLPDGEATIDIKSIKENIYTLEISSFFSCFSEPSDPTLTLSKVGITLSVKSHNTKKDAVALCDCEHKMFIKIKVPTVSGDVPINVNDFYYVQDNAVLGHAIITERKIQPTKP